MNAASLGQRQLFGIKKDNLLKRISTYFEETNNAGEVVEYFVAVLVRHALSVGDYSINELSDLIRNIFLTSEPTDTLRQHCVYFQDYFPDEKDWKTVIQRLFASEAAFRDYTREASAYKALLDEKNREVPVLSDYQFNLVSVFKDVTESDTRGRFRISKGPIHGANARHFKNLDHVDDLQNRRSPPFCGIR